MTGDAVDYGTEFVTAFPENLAYFFPLTVSLKLKITTFLSNTNVIVSFGSTVQNRPCSSPGVYVVDVSAAEVDQFGVSGNTVRISSDNIITVLSLSMRGDSTQSNVVPPTTHLGMEYLVPSPNYTDVAVHLNNYTISQFTDSTVVPMDFSYRLIIINAEDDNNTVTVTQRAPTGVSTETITLGPFSLIQLPSSDYWYKVTSTAKVAVILTNPCMDTQNCRCNMVAHQLRPTDFQGTNFIFPSFNNTNMRLFVTSDVNNNLNSGSESRSVVPGSIGLLPYLPDLDTGSPSLTVSQPASVRVIYPGLIIDLLPNNMFSGCYLVHTNVPSNAKALVIVETGQKSSLTIGTVPVTGATWNDLSDEGYSWALIDLSNCRSCVIWHPSSPIVVYVYETSGSGVSFGGPAISINNEPGKVPVVLQAIKSIFKV